MTKDAPPTEQRIGVFLFLVESSAGGTWWSRPIRSASFSFQPRRGRSVSRGALSQWRDRLLILSRYFTMSSDDDHYLGSYLSEILPAIGLDVETYAPYVTGYVSHKIIHLSLFLT